jgi:hypothetical protein
VLQIWKNGRSFSAVFFAFLRQPQKILFMPQAAYAFFFAQRDLYRRDSNSDETKTAAATGGTVQSGAYPSPRMQTKAR